MKHPERNTTDSHRAHPIDLIQKRVGPWPAQTTSNITYLLLLPPDVDVEVYYTKPEIPGTFAMMRINQSVESLLDTLKRHGWRMASVDLDDCTPPCVTINWNPNIPKGHIAGRSPERSFARQWRNETYDIRQPESI